MGKKTMSRIAAVSSSRLFAEADRSVASLDGLAWLWGRSSTGFSAPDRNDWIGWIGATSLEALGCQPTDILGTWRMWCCRSGLN
jgi:hypothetical protein